ncbi:MAG TPA: type II toxin-antitoxin system HicA family toxin [Chthoniobacteraceae bacterium]|nr:type II toxin-antitoxin system HicA family toxin [Chthoniobacteraceae bacterium]
MKIPRDCNASVLIKALRKQYGYEPVRQIGSHITLTTQEKGEHSVTVPNHSPLKVGTLQGILKDVSEHHEVNLQELLRLLGL